MVLLANELGRTAIDYAIFKNGDDAIHIIKLIWGSRLHNPFPWEIPRFLEHEDSELGMTKFLWSVIGHHKRIVNFLLANGENKN